MFSDDAKLYKHIKGCGDEFKLQGEIDKLVEWNDEWLCHCGIKEDLKMLWSIQ